RGPQSVRRRRFAPAGALAIEPVRTFVDFVFHCAPIFDGWLSFGWRLAPPDQLFVGAPSGAFLVGYAPEGAPTKNGEAAIKKARTPFGLRAFSALGRGSR